MNLRKLSARPLAILGVCSLTMLLTAWVFVEWTINRHWVPVGSSMQLRYKGPPLPIPGLGVRPPAEDGRFAKVTAGRKTPDELGVIEHMVGPGRHFYCPYWWECRIIADTVIEPGEVGLVRSKMGRDLPGGQFLVDGDIGATESKGVLRRVLAPGQYRLNPYAYDVEKIKTQQTKSGTQIKHSGWVVIEPGYVGVVTNMADNEKQNRKAGIQNDVLPPGLYPLNPREQQVDIVNVGYRELSIAANMKKGPGGETLTEPSGEPIIADDESGIGFPSRDSFKIRMDFTAIWGVMPDQAADVIREFGNVEAIEKNVIDPQIQSICRIQGSTLGAVELLVGDSRLLFQENTSKEFTRVLSEKNISVLAGLVRHIYIPRDVRTPIQQKNIANELTLTREQEQKTAETEGLLKEAEQMVKLKTEEITAETEKLVAEKVAEGDKTSEETRAETLKLTAAIDRQSAESESEVTRQLGEAEAQGRQMEEEAKADKFKLAVEAFGSGQAYNRWVFAEGLPQDIKLEMLYAGEGTFWTDLKGFSEALLGRQAAQPATAPRPATTPAVRK